MGRPVPRSRMTAALKRVARELGNLDRDWALAGGLAIHAHTRDGSLDDIDIVVRVSDDRDAEQLVRELQERGFTAVIDVEQQDVHRLASVRLEMDEEDSPAVHLLFAASGIEAEVVRDAQVRTVLGLPAPVASAGHLLAMKVLFHTEGRSRDVDDIRLLLDHADAEDRRVAERSLELVARRGFAGGRDLQGDYHALVARGVAARP